MTAIRPSEAAAAADSARKAAAPMAIPPASAGYRRFALTLLLVIFILNFLDRQVINILAEPIKEELGLADWQIGMMTGFAFAIFYTLFGIPIAQLAERRNRPYIIGAALACWSTFTVLCGFAQSFTQLLLARIGVGVGEAGCTPPAHSLISDYTPREKRASALAFYHMGVPLGSLLGLAMGGIVADLYGWRAAFMVAGAPGLLFAIFAATALREPRRKYAAELRARPAPQSNFKETLGHLAKKRSFWLVSFGSAIKAFVGYGHAPFTAAFFFRVHGEELSAIASKFGLQSAGFLGLSLGLISGVAGAFGTWIGGQMADRAAKRDLRAYCSIPAIAALAALPFSIAVFLAPSVPLALALMVPPAIIGSLWFGPVHATAQSVSPPHMRATASALLLFILNIIGLGLGPLGVGLLSDAFAGPMGMGSAEGVRWALIVSSLLAFATFALFWAGRRTIREDFEG